MGFVHGLVYSVPGLQPRGKKQCANCQDPNKTLQAARQGAVIFFIGLLFSLVRAGRGGRAQQAT